MPSHWWQFHGSFFVKARKPLPSAGHHPAYKKGRAWSLHAPPMLVTKRCTGTYPQAPARSRHPPHTSLTRPETENKTALAGARPPQVSWSNPYLPRSTGWSPGRPGQGFSPCFSFCLTGAVETGRCQTVAGCATGTAYILSFSDGDNAIVLIGGANQEWPAGDSVPSGPVGQAMRRAVAVMLQREIPARVNAGVAALASRAGVPVILDVGGTDEALDSALLPFVTLIAPNESELTFISGVQAVETNSGAESISGVPAVEDHSGAVSISGVRAGVAALKARFGAAGNPQVEVLVTLGRLGSIHFGADWALVDDPISSSSPNAHLHPSAGDASGGAQDDSAASRGMLPHETRMGIFSIKRNQPVDTTGAGDCYRGSFVAARCAVGFQNRTA